MLHEKMISPEDLSLIHLTDSPQDAVKFIIKTSGATAGKQIDPSL